MKNVKLIVSYDIQDENGLSLLKEETANSVVLPVEGADFKNFLFTSARLRLEAFAGHLYACFLQESHLTNQNENPRIKVYNYPLEFPQNLSVAWDYRHSKVVIKGSGNPYITLKEDREKLRTSGLIDEYLSNNQSSPPPTVRQIMGLDP